MKDFRRSDIILTIVVAAYNVSNFISDTIDSIINQLTDYCEMIVIDDGSTDGTTEIVEKRRSEFEFRFITQKNHGISYVRNTGIKQARGKYIWFVDGDDKINLNSVTTLIDAIDKSHDPDIILCNYITEFPDSSKLFRQFEQSENGHTYIQRNDLLIRTLWKDGTAFSWSVWSNIYSVDFLRNNNIFFNERLFYNEDGDWVMSVLTKTHLALLLDYPIYIYNRKNNASITSKRRTLDKYKCSHYTISKWFRYFEKEKNDVLIKRFSNYYMNAALSLYDIDDKGDRSCAIKLFLEDEDIIFFGDNIYVYMYKALFLFPAKTRVMIINRTYSIIKRLRNR